MYFAFRGPIEKAGLGDLHRVRTGYSIGVNFQPWWGEGHICSLRPGNRLELQAGMAFHCAPFVSVPSAFGIAFTETLVVTQDNCEILGGLPRELLAC